MSRVGKSPLPITKGVTVTVNGEQVTVKGAQGELAMTLPGSVRAAVNGDVVNVTVTLDTRAARSLHGLTRSLIGNMIEGVSKGYAKVLLIEGVGFKGLVQGKDKLALSLGFASPVQFTIPAGIKVVDEGGTKLTISGMDKQLVGDIAAQIRSFFPAEPYKGKGIRYEGEHVKRKVGKTVA